MMDEAPDADLFVRFLEARAGWVSFEVGTARARREISASIAFDPFPRFFGWLRGVAAASEPCQWIVDGEGYSHRLIYAPVPWNEIVSVNEGLLILTDDIDPREPELPFTEPPLRFIVEPETVVRAFYESFREFVTSDRFDPAEWGAWPGGDPAFDVSFSAGKRSADIEAWLDQREGAQ